MATGTLRRRTVPPRHPRFVEDVLWPLAARAEAGEDAGRLADELYETAVHPWALSQAQAKAAGLPPHADPAEVTSQVLRLAWEACGRIDWSRVESWPALLEHKVRTARIEAARSEDWLSRRERVYKRRYQRAVAALEQERGRTLTESECVDVARPVAPPSNRVDWGRELVAGKHPSTVAELPEVHGGCDPGEDVVERLTGTERAAGLRRWLAVVVAEDPRLAEELCRWHDRTGAVGPLPARLARKVEPFAPLLAGLVSCEG